MFKKKQLTPDEKISIARKQQDKALKKRNRLDKKHENDPLKAFDTDYKDKRNEINRTFARAISDEKAARELAKEEAKHPKPVPKTVKIDKSKHATFEATFGDIGSNNKNGINDNEVLSGNKIANKTGAGKKETSTAPKKSKLKTIVIWVVAVLVLAGVAGLSSYITNCARDCKDNSSCTYSSFIL